MTDRLAPASIRVDWEAGRAIDFSGHENIESVGVRTELFIKSTMTNFGLPWYA